MRQYTTTQAGIQLHVQKEAIQRAIQRGKLIAYKMGRDWFIDDKELKRWQEVRQRRVNFKA